MRNLHRLACAAVFAIAPMLSGCFLISTTRRLPVPKAPAVVQTVTPDQLVSDLNQRWDAMKSMTAKVEIQASVLKAEKGVATDYTTIGGVILFSKPENLRVLGRAPMVGLTMFDMASDGQNFTMYIPSKKVVYKGSDKVKGTSKNPLENLRPDFFRDALVVQGLDPDEDYYSVTTDQETVEDAAKKHLFSVPEYILSITRHIPGKHEDKPVRVITFHRDDLLPYEQDMYDENGNRETHVVYSNYQDFGSGKYPSTVTIVRPQENVQAVLTVDTVTQNVDLPADQFKVNVPPDTQVKQLD